MVKQSWLFYVNIEEDKENSELKTEVMTHSVHGGGVR